MGLISASEVPPSSQLLTDATFPEFSNDQQTAITFVPDGTGGVTGLRAFGVTFAKARNTRR